MADVISTANKIGTTSAGFANVELKDFYEKNLMAELRSNLYLYPLCEKTTLPKNVGDTVTWRVFKDLSPITTELGELDPGSQQTLKIVEFKTSIKSYGAWTAISSRVDDLAIDPILAKTSELFGRQAAVTFERLIYTGAVGTKNVFTAAGDATNHRITVSDINRVKAYFKKANVKPHTSGKYIAIISPEVEMDLKNLTANNASWIDISKYAKPEEAYAGEIGEFLGFKWIVSNEVTTVGDSGTDKDYHKCLFLGAEGLGVVNLEGESNAPAIIYKAAGSAGTADPLNQVCTLGWKNKGFCVRILRDEAVMLYKVAVSDTVTNTSITDSTRSNYDKATL